MLKPPHTPEIEHAFWYCRIWFADILQRVSVPLLMRDSSLYSPFADVLISFWCRCSAGHIKQLGKCSLLCYFPKESACRIAITSSSSIWQIPLVTPPGPALFFLEWFLITNSIYFTGMEPLRFPVSFCLSFGKLHLSISSKSLNLLAQSFHNIPGDSLWQDLGRNYQVFEESVFSRCPSITAWLRLPALNSDLKTIGPLGPCFLHLRYGSFFLVLTRQ